VPDAELLDDPSRAIAADRDGMRLCEGDGVRTRAPAESDSDRLSVDEAPLLRWDAGTPRASVGDDES